MLGQHSHDFPQHSFESKHIFQQSCLEKTKHLCRRRKMEKKSEKWWVVILRIIKTKLLLVATSWFVLLCHTAALLLVHPIINSRDEVMRKVYMGIPLPAMPPTRDYQWSRQDLDSSGNNRGPSFAFLFSEMVSLSNISVLTLGLNKIEQIHKFHQIILYVLNLFNEWHLVYLPSFWAGSRKLSSTNLRAARSLSLDDLKVWSDFEKKKRKSLIRSGHQKKPRYKYLTWSALGKSIFNATSGVSTPLPGIMEQGPPGRRYLENLLIPIVESQSLQ